MPKKKALLFALSRQPLEELEELLLTAGGKSVGEVLGRKEEVDPDYYFGEGKLEELKRRAEELGPDFLLADDPLSPRQERNLERYTGFPVLDRTALILDIFALHAESAAGKLQVEIAQIEYNLTRMRGLWPHLERLGAGIGTRGPGESQIETDRRLARKRLSLLRKRLEKIDRGRERNRQERIGSGVPRIALFGYTNAGKSTLQNELCRNGQKQSGKLFHTLDSKTSSYVLDSNQYLLSDTVGLIDKLPHSLIAAFRGTLEEALSADLLLHIVDGRKADQEILVAESMLYDLEISDKRRLLVINKSDLLRDQEKDHLRSRYPSAIFISASEEWGLEELRLRIAREVSKDMEKIRLRLPGDSPYLPYHLKRLAFEKKEEKRGDTLYLDAFTPKAKAYLFREYL